MLIKRKTKITASMIFLALAILLSFASVSAYTKLCLKDCEGTPTINPRYVCELGSKSRCGDPGYCEICVTDIGNPTAPYRCAGQACGMTDNNSTIDITPPSLTVNDPDQNSVYSSKAVLFNLLVDEESSIYFTDNIKDDGRWKKICAGCLNYNGKISLNEGLNNITVKAADKNENSAEKTLSFFVDSKKPKIKKTEPKSDFTSSIFKIEFEEENPKELWLNYGNSLEGYRSKKFNLALCAKEKKISTCEEDIDLKDYDGQEIEYWFALSDIANSVVESKHIWVNVDETSPIITNPDSFWTQNGKYIYFSLEITETNFDSVEFIDNSDRRPRWKTLCSRLKDGKCEAKKSFISGEHVLDIQVTDKAGNSVGKRISFVV